MSDISIKPKTPDQEEPKTPLQKKRKIPSAPKIDRVRKYTFENPKKVQDPLSRTLFE